MCSVTQLVTHNLSNACEARKHRGKPTRLHYVYLLFNVQWSMINSGNH